MSHKVFITSDMSLDERLSDIADSHPQAALMWPWMITAFDDWGRADASPKRLKAQVFPMMGFIHVEDVAEALMVYAAAGLIICYEVSGHSYMYIAPEKWYRYQTHIRGDKRDRDDSRYPAPPARTPDPDPQSSAQTRANARSDAQTREDARLARAPRPSPSPSPSPSTSSDVAVALSSVVTAPKAPDDDEPAARFAQDSDAVQLATHLRSQILAVLPGANVPKLTLSALQPWAKHIDKMLRLDGRSPEQVRAVIDFARASPFWQTNILSAEKLRQKYDTLDAQRQRPMQPLPRASPPRQPPPMEYRLDEDVWPEEFAAQNGRKSS